jgi:hypothetical protein
MEFFLFCFVSKKCIIDPIMVEGSFMSVQLPVHIGLCPKTYQVYGRSCYVTFILPCIGLLQPLVTSSK